MPDAFESGVLQARKSIVGKLEEGKDVVLVCHSYAGIVGYAALKWSYEGPNSNVSDAPFEELRKGSTGKGRVRRIVACAAWILPDGRSLEDELGVILRPGCVLRHGTYNFTHEYFKNIPMNCHFRRTALCTPTPPSSPGYNAVSDDINAKAFPLLQPQAYETFNAQGR